MFVLDKIEVIDKVIRRLGELSEELQEWLNNADYDDDIAGLMMYIDDVAIQATNMEQKMARND